MLLLAVILAPIHAHTDQELTDWLEDYSALAVVHPGVVEVYRLILEDMRDRHPCRAVIDTWSEACEIPVPSPVPAGPLPGAAPSADRGMGTGVEAWRSAVSVYDWNVEIALCLMGKESGGNPDAYNESSGASGLMQVLASWADNFGYQPADLFIPEVNLAISYALYADGGWNHWAPWLRGSCR